MYISRVPKNPIVIQQAAHQALGMCFYVRFLRFNPPLYNFSHRPSNSMWYLKFSSTSQLGASKRKGLFSQCMLGEVLPRFKAFLVAPAQMRFQVF
jgi:hypothetical protein